MLYAFHLNSCSGTVKYVSLMTKQASSLAYWGSSAFWVTSEQVLCDTQCIAPLAPKGWPHCSHYHIIKWPMASPAFLWSTCWHMLFLLLLLLAALWCRGRRTCWWTATGTSAPWRTYGASSGCGRRRSNEGNGGNRPPSAPVPFWLAHICFTLHVFCCSVGAHGSAEACVDRRYQKSLTIPWGYTFLVYGWPPVGIELATPKSDSVMWTKVVVTMVTMASLNNEGGHFILWN